ncbi:hypothetical protein HanIR_Chr15g0751501 [Helianthus annuus]|nr:hypothetical protein HanIR_Chr15g0751501 [Helianthus annuus]
MLYGHSSLSMPLIIFSGNLLFLAGAFVLPELTCWSFARHSGPVAGSSVSQIALSINLIFEWFWFDDGGGENSDLWLIWW